MTKYLEGNLLWVLALIWGFQDKIYYDILFHDVAKCNKPICFVMLQIEVNYFMGIRME